MATDRTALVGAMLNGAGVDAQHPFATFIDTAADFVLAVEAEVDGAAPEDLDANDDGVLDVGSSVAGAMVAAAGLSPGFAQALEWGETPTGFRPGSWDLEYIPVDFLIELGAADRVAGPLDLLDDRRLASALVDHVLDADPALLVEAPEVVVQQLHAELLTGLDR